jgi:hypothetical protein
MKEEALIKKIKEKAEIFKSRKQISPRDDQRHDQIRRDEQKWMWAAYNQLGWSFAKIGSVFERDPRAVKNATERYNRQKKQVRTPSIKDISMNLPKWQRHSTMSSNILGATKLMNPFL